MSKPLREKILELTEKVGIEKTICPSDVARALWPLEWRFHMEEVRQVAVELRAEERIEICQKGLAVEGNQFTGPIRLRKKTRGLE